MATKHKRCHGITRGGSRCKRKATGGAFCGAHPSANGRVTKTGFADLQGVDPGMVTKYIAAGTIEPDDEGRIDWQRASQRVERARDVTATTRRGGQKSPEVKAVINGTEMTLDDCGMTADEIKRRREIAKMFREEEQARLANIEREEAEERLICAESIQRKIADQCLNTRAQLLTIPGRVAGDLVGLTDQREISTIIEDEIRDCLHELTRSLDVSE